ncbi:multicomponent Na+:H+ antiporter subunit A [Amycolatopsis marina]|uniref:Multicomponent Na+:H+ antiporter subunit A n=1 Tax=Amycolatopsis marina TaxID=490629 RepID=A0A1I0ZG53_9PSEU|nr:hydrogen gas-evolving membrane-bound hydrogenase subunit E [Amycolatopsis marina]SFB23378.1 multicomponent Na+:H+ antiporter subunit A [Amycolatopsis marina]
MLIAIAAHLLVAAVLPVVARFWGRAAFAVAALVPAATLVLTLARSGEVLHGEPVTESLAWAPVIGLEFTVRLDALSLLMIVLVSGIGALVLAYYVSYAKGEHGIGRDATVLLVFAGAMLGLVVADDVLSFYVFWELTTVCSFLLVGGAGATRAVRRSATQALLVTTFGGLAMLLGLILLGDAAGTFRISEILADPPSGAVVNVAVVLVLLGAFTKSAQVPFHPWLPAAMVAPTPVSAYLHAAAMVKAGVYLVARFAPAFATLPAWWLPVVVVGLCSMVLGGVRAMRQHDLKELLAFGTISQLGFLIVLVGVGTHTAAVAGAAMVLAHGLFKSALFLSAGAIDKRAGTRDIRELSGLGRRWPGFALLVALAAASMAGIPPLLGYVGKEAALEAFAHGGVRELLILAGLVLGSLFTVAYSLRFVVGAFGTKRGVDAVRVSAPGWGFTAPVLVPVAASLVFGLVVGWVEPLAAGYAEAYPAGTEPYHLALWHGFSLPLLLSAIILGGGYLIHAHGRFPWWDADLLPKALDAQHGYRSTVSALDRTAHGVTGRVQTGSLPAYLGIILITVIVLPSAGLFAGVVWPSDMGWFDSWLQLPLAAAVLIAAVTVPMARRRLTAVLLTGMVGYGIGGLFVVYGGVDLALAQFLVESLTLVIFVLVLRRLPPSFTQGRRPVPSRRWLKGTVAVTGGLFVATAAVLFSTVREQPLEASREYIARAEPEAGAHNVVNAILVDFRALDTVGEITVLLVTATGVASLGLAARSRRRRRVPEAGSEARQEEDARS